MRAGIIRTNELMAADLARFRQLLSQSMDLTLVTDAVTAVADDLREALVEHQGAGAPLPAGEELGRRVGQALRLGWRTGRLVATGS